MGIYRPTVKTLCKNFRHKKKIRSSLHDFPKFKDYGIIIATNSNQPNPTQSTKTKQFKQNKPRCQLSINNNIYGVVNIWCSEIRFCWNRNIFCIFFSIHWASPVWTVKFQHNFNLVQYHFHLDSEHANYGLVWPKSLIMTNAIYTKFIVHFTRYMSMSHKRQALSARPKPGSHERH